MSTYNQMIGRLGEQAGATYLKKLGYQIVDQNVRTPYGEIDLIAKKEGVLVFVEVKTRSSQEYGYPEEAVTAQKLMHMMESAQHILSGQFENYQDIPFQFDVLSVRVDKEQKILEIKHIQNVQQ